MSGKQKGGKKQQKAEEPAEEPKVEQTEAAPAAEEDKSKGKGKGKKDKGASPSSSPKPTPAATPAPVPEKKEAPAAAPAPEKKTYNNDPNERTFLAIKPDGVQRGLVGEIISRFEKRGYKLVGLKMLTPTKKQTEEHYEDLKGRKFFNGLVEYFSSGPIVAMVWQGKNVVATGRLMLGETNPLASNPGTIRGDYSLDLGRNVIHGSDSVESGKREVAFWFKEEELNNWTSANEKWIYE